MQIVKKEYIENDSSLVFKTIPLSKVIILSILSILSSGLYAYWFLIYGYWKSLQQNFGYKVSPFWRMLFSLFTNFKLFPILEKYFKNFNIKTVNLIALAFIDFIVYSIGGRLSFKYWNETNLSIELITNILTLISILIFVYIQNKINNVNKTYFPNASRNEWTIANIIWAILLGLLNCLYLIGIFLSE